MLELISSPDAWIALLTLTALEIVLGIDNIVFIAILASRLPVDQQGLAYRLGLMGAMLTRIALLLTINWVMQLTEPIFELVGHPFSGRDLILLGGGLFLIAKSAQEIYDKVEGEEHGDIRGWFSGLPGIVAQIMVLDVIFSLDSVITAVGMAEQIEVMVTAVVIAIAVMLVFARQIGDFINRFPSMKILALSFLLLIGVLLTAEGLGQHINKGYIYFAMAFALIVELLNIRFRTRQRAA
jgi:predicted tellurium resistance membrane protein TerC